MGRLSPRTGALSLGAALVLLGLTSAAAGAVHIPPSQTLLILAGALGLPVPPAADPVHEAVLLGIRLPRIGLAALCGAALATSGAMLQGLFRNPLADPGLLGVSSGAALAAAATVVLGLGGLSLPLAAFVGGLGATAAVLAIGGRVSGAPISQLLLAGIGVNALCGAGVGVLVFSADDAALRSFTFWTLGSVGGATWSQLGLASVGAGLPVLGAALLARRLDVLMLGETDAEALGISVTATRRVVVVLCALAVGTSVALCGIIGFIGLVAPHLVRLSAGPLHRVVLPGSALLGSVLLLGADLVARTAVAPLELPVGVVTTLLGGPFLLWLLSRTHP
jgi:iron complex transport system permease protein